MMIKYVLLLMLLQFCCTQLTLGHSVICESPGHCEETMEDCVNDLLDDCITGNDAVYNQKKYANYEPSDRANNTILNSSRASCEQTAGWSSMERTNMTLESLKLDYISRSPKYVTVCATWNLTQSSGQNGGFVVEVMSQRRQVDYRYCVTDPATRRVCINNFLYSTLQNVERFIRVYPFQLDGNDVIDANSKTERIHDDLVGCADVSQSVGTCGPKHYSSADNLTVRSCLHEDEDGAKDLRITWEPPTGAVELPGTYFVTLYAQNKPWRYFKVTDSLQVTVRNVSASFNYSVKVQPYGRCVGLGDYPTTRQLGCGVPTYRMKETLTKHTDLSPSTGLDDIITSPAGHTLVVLANDRTFTGYRLFLTIMLVAVAVVVAAAVVLTAIMCVALHTFRHHQRSLSGQTKKSKYTTCTNLAQSLMALN